MRAVSAEGFGTPEIVVVGDLMLDCYVWGRVDRISPEAPVPVVRVERESESAGGAANVALNLRALGSEVSLFGVVGRDAAGTSLKRVLEENEIDLTGVVIADSRMTTRKTRVLSKQQQMLRLDLEVTEPIERALEDDMIELVLRRISAGVDAVVISDYAKGVCTPRLCERIIGAARASGCCVVVDPKGLSYGKYRGATGLCPNVDELGQVMGYEVTDDTVREQAALRLFGELELTFLAVTLGAHGIALYEDGRSEHFPAQARKVFDVSGAGDTVAAVLALGLVAGLEPPQAVALANRAAWIVVGKLGPATVSLDELRLALHQASLETRGSSKVMGREEVTRLVRGWRADGQRVVMTNGCFDLLHVGHTTYLTEARRRGDKLVVALNTDASVQRLKGDGRPLNSEGARANLLAALAAVDAVVSFDSDTPLALIEEIRPDVLVKGADYAESDIVGAAQVRSWGGDVVTIELVDGYSSTGLMRGLEQRSVGVPS
jgi:D-beta-D-heptose 7-phosphate kinase/D-beta-D-heptose 1-phosphate adenosyltransferase